jgi:hypothetical protein
MKKNLLLSYCSFIVFYLLLKIEGEQTDSHQVVYKLAHIRTLFDKLKPLDAKMEKAVAALLMASSRKRDDVESKESESQ